MDKFKIVVKTNQQTLRQINIFLRDNDTQCECSQHEDQHGNQRTDKHSLRIIDGRIFDIFHMDTPHFHTSIKKEYTGRKYQIIELREVGEEIAVEVHIGMTAGSQIHDT